MQSLLDGLRSRQNTELVLGNLPRDAQDVGRLPGKSVLVGAEEVDERVFLFGRQLGADQHHLGWIGVIDHNRLCLFSRDESRSLAWLAGVGTTLGDAGAELPKFRCIRGH